MSLEIPFGMRNLTSFQMKNLCYYLKVEVLKEMDAKDTIELVKVNAEFQSMLPRNPWLVYGHHLHEISLDQCERIYLWKLSGSSYVKFDATQLSLTKRIHSCDELSIDWRQEEVTNEFVAILNQLKSVKFLNFQRKCGECFPKFLENFHSVVEKSVRFPESMCLDNKVVRKLFDKFIVNQAKDCEELYDSSCGSFHCYYDTFAKTSIKFFMICVFLDKFEEMVQSIVEKQIPSKNLKAAVYLVALCSQEVNARIVDFLSHFPGMKRLDKESHQEVIKMAEKLVKKHVAKHYVVGEIDFTNDLFFQRNIDSNRDCVYMLQSNAKGSTEFLAFYVQPQKQMMQF